MKQSKAQIAVTDFYVAFFIVILLILVIVYSWNLYTSRLNSNLEFDEMKIKGFQITDTFVKSKGFPKNWNQDNVRIIGLAESDRKLSPTKVSNFINLTNEQIKSILNIALYDFYFSLETDTETITKGYDIPSITMSSLNIKRYVIYEDETAIMEFTLWK